MTNNYLFEMVRKIIFTNYFSEFIHQVAIKFRFWKAFFFKCILKNTCLFVLFVFFFLFFFWKPSLNYYLCISNLIKYIFIIFLKTDNLSIPKGTKKFAILYIKLYQNNTKTSRKKFCEWLSKLFLLINIINPKRFRSIKPVFNFAFNNEKQIMYPKNTLVYGYAQVA